MSVTFCSFSHLLYTVSSGVSSTADVELKEKHSIAEPEQKVALDGDGKEEPA